MATYIQKNYTSLSAAVNGLAQEYHTAEDKHASFILVAKISKMVLETTRQKGHASKRTIVIRKESFSVERKANGHTLLSLTKNTKQDTAEKVVEGLFNKNVPIHELQTRAKIKIPVTVHNPNLEIVREGLGHIGRHFQTVVESLTLPPLKLVDCRGGFYSSRPTMESTEAQLERIRQKKEIDKILARLNAIKII